MRSCRMNRSPGAGNSSKFTCWLSPLYAILSPLSRPEEKKKKKLKFISKIVTIRRLHEQKYHSATGFVFRKNLVRSSGKAPDNLNLIFRGHFCSHSRVPGASFNLVLLSPYKLFKFTAATRWEPQDNTHRRPTAYCNYTVKQFSAFRRKSDPSANETEKHPSGP